MLYLRVLANQLAVNLNTSLDRDYDAQRNVVLTTNVGHCHFLIIRTICNSSSPTSLSLLCRYVVDSMKSFAVGNEV